MPPSGSGGDPNLEGDGVMAMREMRTRGSLRANASPAKRRHGCARRPYARTPALQPRRGFRDCLDALEPGIGALIRIKLPG